MPTSPTGTYLPIRVVAPVGSPCQSDSPGTSHLSAGCAQDKMPLCCSEGRPGHGGQELEETTEVGAEKEPQHTSRSSLCGPPKGLELLFTAIPAPGSKHLDETQVGSMEHHPDIHDSQRALSELGLQELKVSCLPISSGISSPACPSSSVQFDKWHLHRSSSCQTHSSHPTPPPTTALHAPYHLQRCPEPSAATALPNPGRTPPLSSAPLFTTTRLFETQILKNF